MKIKKIKATYNDYDVELSFGQLLAIKNALATDHSDPLSDELYAELEWYLSNIPGPGESEEDLKKAEEAGESGLGTETGEESPLEPKLAGGADEFLPAPDEDMGGESGPEGDLGPEAAPEGGPESESESGPGPGPEDEGSEADRRIPVPEEA